MTDYPEIEKITEEKVLDKKQTENDTSELVLSDLTSELILEGSDAERVEKMLSNPQPNPRRRKFIQEFEKRSKP